MRPFLTVPVLLVALILVEFVNNPAWAWEVIVVPKRASGDLVCLVSSPNTDLAIYRHRYSKSGIFEAVYIGTENVPGSHINVNVDNVYYFDGDEDEDYPWGGEKLLTAVLAGRTAWVEWIKWPGDTIQQKIDLTGIKAAYHKCVRATNG